MLGDKFGENLLASATGQKDMLQQKLAIDAVKNHLRAGASDEKKLKEACEGFEAIFIEKLWKQMRATVPKEGYLHSKEEEHYLGMFDHELSKKMAGSGGMGLADMLYRQLQEQLSAAGRYTSTKDAANPLPMKDLEQAKMQPQAQPEATAFDDSPENLYAPLEDETTPPGLHTQASPKASVRVTPQARAEALARAIETRMGSIQESVAEPAATARETGPPPSEPLTWPADGRISSGFGWRNDPFTGQRAWHAGLDIEGEPGDSVRACWDGEVIFSGPKDGYGNLVIVDHGGGWRSYYGHNLSNNVRAGDTIEAGRKIAELGNTGRSTGPHLHFELRQGDQAFHPQRIQQRLLAGLTIGNNA